MKKLILQLLELLIRLVGGEKIENEILLPQDGADVLVEEYDTIQTPEKGSQTFGITSHFHWVIDPGHGPRTRGKQSPPLPEDGYVFYEYEYNHDIARRVCLQLSDLKISHSQTVHLHPNLGNELRKRTDYANNFKTEKPKRFVSIHANAARSLNPNVSVEWRPDVEGTETFVHTNHSPMSFEMAQIFNDRLSRLLQSRNRGVKTANYHVLRETEMPACLIEVDFFTNPEFVRLSRTEAHREAVASSIVESILELETFSSTQIEDYYA